MTESTHARPAQPVRTYTWRDFERLHRAVSRVTEDYRAQTGSPDATVEKAIGHTLAEAAVRPIAERTADHPLGYRAMDAELTEAYRLVFDAPDDALDSTVMNHGDGMFTDEGGDLNDLLGVGAEQMIAARATADTALAAGDVDALAAALDRMGVPAEDDTAFLARALLELPAEVQHRRLDQLELMNTRPADQAAVLEVQRSRLPAAGPISAAPGPGHPARVAAAALDRPPEATMQPHRQNVGDRAAEGVARSPAQPSARTDRRSTTNR
jgi:hypothetical protein